MERGYDETTVAEIAKPPRSRPARSSAASRPRTGSPCPGPDHRGRRGHLSRPGGMPGRRAAGHRIRRRGP
ncbi:hypothetical protein ABZZ21_35425 [Streptomyces ossamyceticus]|uniref:TetR family transcriptional regulator n=1 Tax=Streptomyces ossamyceticus TaxID=249581 RepID=A0ABV2V7D8_9ACTN